MSLLVSYLHLRNPTVGDLCSNRTFENICITDYKSRYLLHATLPRNPRTPLASPNVKEDPDGPLRPKVIGLDTHLLCRLVEPSTEEKRDHGHEVLY